MNTIHKGYCCGCPYDLGQEATEMAYNLGCLPSTWEIKQATSSRNMAWACHDDFSKVCCGYAVENPKEVNKKLLTLDEL